MSNNPLADIINVVHDTSLKKPRRFWEWFYCLHYVTGFGKNVTPFGMLVEVMAAKELSDKIWSLSAIKRSLVRTPVGGEFSHTRPDRPRGPASFLYNVYRVFAGGKAAGALRWPPSLS